MNDVDVLIIGGGHNGLVCACYLANAGHKVTIIERRDIVGGAAVTEEFHPGFRNSVASYTVSLLNPKVIKDLKLYEHGLEIISRPVSNFLPLDESNYLIPGASLVETQKQFALFSKHDAEVLPAYYRMLKKVADVLRSMLLETPPNVGGGLIDLWRGGVVAKRLHKLSMPERRDVLDLFTMSAGEMLDNWFESAPIKALFGFDSIVGNYASPYAPGSAYVLLHHVFGEVNGKRGEWGHAVGGMGAITQAMEKEAKARGVKIRVSAPVANVDIENNKVTGVTLENGEHIDARCVVSNLNPRLLYEQLIEPDKLDSDFLSRIKNYKCGSGTLRMNVALTELPDFTCLPGTELQTHHKSGIIIGPSLDYMEQAYVDARKHGWSKAPVVEMLIPSTVDASLAPEGKHVASLFCQHFSPNLNIGKSWDDVKETVADLVIDTVNQYAPNFKQSVIARMVLTPLDLERKFGLINGDIMHGALSQNQLYSARPVLGYGNYRGPIANLYMCGSGTHPGGGVTGIPGHNAAHEIIRDLKKSRI